MSVLVIQSVMGSQDRDLGKLGNITDATPDIARYFQELSPAAFEAVYKSGKNVLLRINEKYSNLSLTPKQKQMILALGVKIVKYRKEWKTWHTAWSDAFTEVIENATDTQSKLVWLTLAPSERSKKYAETFDGLAFDLQQTQNVKELINETSQIAQTFQSTRPILAIYPSDLKNLYKFAIHLAQRGPTTYYEIASTIN